MFFVLYFIQFGIKHCSTKAGQSIIKINFCFVFATTEKKTTQRSTHIPLIFMLFIIIKTTLFDSNLPLIRLNVAELFFLPLLLLLLLHVLFVGLKCFILSCSMAPPIQKTFNFCAMYRYVWFYVFFRFRKHFKCFGTSIPSHLIGYEMFHIVVNGIELKRIKSMCILQWNYHY